ncbi:uncharacterized protein LOC125842880 [Solanum stenotomum]|uniref:uncharacterized protein LOC125842880 n=1 Tax=Solanum stenotomum TaxID=172797 RepID=UPI0020D05F3D|nr:uncharacterized protein LOC125842880 [Solanum stenotomum]
MVNAQDMWEKLLVMWAWGSSSNAYSMWDRTGSGIRKEAREVLGVSGSSSGWHQGDRWRNGEVHKNVEAKKISFAKLVEIKDNEENRTNGVRYKLVKKEAKLAVTTAKTIAYDCMYVELKGKGRDKNLNILTKVREKRARD